MKFEKIITILYEQTQPKCKAIYQTGSRVLPFIKNTKDFDLVIYLDSLNNYTEKSQLKLNIYNILKQITNEKYDIHLDTLNNKNISYYYCLYPYMKKNIGEDNIFPILDITICKKVAKDKFKEFIEKSVSMKRWYLLVYDYYILKNDLSYELTDEQKEVLNALHDNAYDKNKFKELKLEMEIFLNN